MSDFHSITRLIIYFHSFCAAFAVGFIVFLALGTYRLCRRRARFGDLVYRTKPTWVEAVLCIPPPMAVLILFWAWHAFAQGREMVDEGPLRVGMLLQWTPPIMLTILAVLMFAFAVMALATRLEIRRDGLVSNDPWNVRWKRVRRVIFSSGSRLIIEHDRGVCSARCPKRERADIASALGEAGVSIVDDPEYTYSFFREWLTVYARPMLLTFGFAVAVFFAVVAWFYFTLAPEYAAARRLGKVANINQPDFHIWAVWFREEVTPTEEHLRLLHEFSQLSYLGLSETGLDDSTTRPLASMTQLIRLHLDNTRITDKTLARLSRMKQLRMLTLSGTRITGDGLRHLEGMQNLEELRLQRTEMTEAGLASLGKLRKLQKLSLGETPVQDAWLTPLLDLPKLNSLCLDDTNITDDSVEALAKLRQLKDLSLCGTRITDSSAETLKRMTHLERLNIRDTAISPEVAREIAKVLGNDRVRWRPQEEVEP